MTANLQVRTLELIPAVVKFNFEDLAAALDVQLKKYEGLTFTDETATDCKKTITELNKAKKALDTYRKNTKQELTVAVTVFEQQCKELGAKFDKTIEPLKAQYDDFEWNRKEAKRKEIEPIIKDLIEKEGLNEKYAAQLVIPTEFYNKAKSMKSIKQELTTQAQHLGIQQDKEDGDRTIITDFVELTNMKHNSNLPAAPFLNLIGIKTIDEIKELIKLDASVKTTQTFDAPTANSTELVTEKYSVVGTDEQLDSLEQYMTNQGIKWAVIEG